MHESRYIVKQILCFSKSPYSGIHQFYPAFAPESRHGKAPICVPTVCRTLFEEGRNTCERRVEVGPWVATAAMMALEMPGGDQAVFEGGRAIDYRSTQC
jgi:hypothetical protein